MATSSHEDYYNTGKTEVNLRRPSLPVNPGDIVDVVLNAGAAMAEKIDARNAARVKATYLDGAKGELLDKLGDDHWNQQRVAAAKSTGTAIFNRTSAAAGAGTINAGTVVATAVDAAGNDVRFVTDAPVSYGGAETGDKSVATTAELAGREGNIEATKINRIIDTLFDTSITVRNDAKFIGGAPADDDDTYREQVRVFPSTLSKATNPALEFGIKKDVPAIKIATAIENAITGIVTLYVADADGNSNATMVSDAEAALVNWRAGGSAVVIVGGTLLAQDVTATIVVRTGTPTAVVTELMATFAAAITARMAKLSVGETLYLDWLKHAIIDVAPDIVLAVTFTTPSGDVVPAATQVIRAGTIILSS